MNEKSWLRVLNSYSDNLKSKTCPELCRRIQNPKWTGRFALVVTLAMCGVVAQAQQRKKVPRIGFLSAQDPASDSTRFEAIRLALRERGYIEGQNIAIEYRYAEGKPDRYPDLLAELLHLKVDIILVAGGNLPIQAAKNATKTIPIVMTGAGPDPVAAGYTLQPWEVRDADGFEKVFAALNKERPNGLYVSGGQLMRANEKRIAGFALKSRLPSMYQSREAVDAGELMSYGADLADSYRRVATYVDKILKGAKPADLPVEQPTKFELVINLKTAKQIGLTIPQRVLGRADKVIK